jgi:TetR/AcrR family transcriptional regulator
MVTVLHHGENVGKLGEILKEAKRRFGLYGFERTTMKEIAGGFNMSKASLYYYFPDKESLFQAVIKREQDLFFRTISRKFSKLDSAEEMLVEFIKQRHLHFKKFVNLNIFRYSNVEKIRPHISATFLNFRERETQVIISILNNGIKSREFICVDPVVKASLFLDVLHGLRLVVMNFRDYTELSKLDYDKIEQKHQQFLISFISSLKISSK